MVRRNDEGEAQRRRWTFCEAIIIASLGLRTPGTSGEVIDILVEYGLLHPEQRDRYISMIQFRNRIVHFYNGIDLKILYQILQEERVDIRELYRTLIQIIEEHPE